MKQRVLTGVALAAFMILLFFTKTLTPYVFDAFLVFVAVVAGMEMSNLLTKIGYYNNKKVIFAYPILAYGLFKLSTSQSLPLYLVFVLQIALVILLAGVVSLFSLLSKKASDNEIKTRKITCTIEQFSLFKGVQTLFGLLYPGFIILAFIFINNLQNMTYYFDKISATASSLSFFLMIFAFLVPIFVDTFAMLTGSLFKGKKLCPKLSPKKTISGAVGGIVWGVLCSVAIFFIFNSIDKFRIIFEQVNITWWKMLIVGLVSTIVCQAGDLFESFLKRKADVKDSGDILPGHGGVLDRLDSHFANIIVVLIFTLIILL